MVHGPAGEVFRVGPEMRVGVQRLLGAGVTEAGLDDLDRLALSNEKRGVVVPEIVKRQADHSDSLAGRLQNLVEPAAAERSALPVAEEKRLWLAAHVPDELEGRGELLKMPGDRLEHNVGHRDLPAAGFRLRWAQ